MGNFDKVMLILVALILAYAMIMYGPILWLSFKWGLIIASPLIVLSIIAGWRGFVMTMRGDG